MKLFGKLISTTALFMLIGLVSSTYAIGIERTCTEWEDIEKTDTFCNYINYITVQEVISGYSDQIFRSETEVTRGQLSKIIVNAFQITQNSQGTSFSDVSKSHTFYSHINTLRNAEIINGYSDGTFRPDETVSRGAVTKFIVNAINYNGFGSKLDNSGENIFPDLEEDSTFKEYILTLYNSTSLFDEDKRILNGYSDGLFKPENTLLRGQVAKIITNSMKYIEIEWIGCDNYFCDLEISLENYLYNLIDDSRKKHAKSTLERDVIADIVARNWSLSMFDANNFDHNPNLSGDFDKTDIDWQSIGENIGYAKFRGFGHEQYWASVKEIHSQMMAEIPPDDGHRKTILSDTYTHIGVGIYVGSEEDSKIIYTTENYYKPF